MTPSAPQCPVCGRARPAGSDVAGPCPFCLLQLGLDGAADPGPGWIDPETWACRVLNVLGAEGGETSYLAEQAAPVTRLVVLTQVIAPVESSEDHSRVTGHLRTLVAFEHPHVARVFGGLLSDAGGLWLVAAYTPGTALASYCARSRLGERDRLLLVLPVVEAVEQFHNLGIVHGRLASSRLVVTEHGGVPHPVVTDLGAGMMRQPPPDPFADVTAVVDVMRTLELAAPPGHVRTAHELADWVRASVAGCRLPPA